MRLWLLGEVNDITEGLKGLIRVMVERADKEKDILLPGYTHLQVCIIYSRFNHTPDSALLNYSEASQYGGHISSFHMLSLSPPTFNASANSFLESQSYR